MCSKTYEIVKNHIDEYDYMNLLSSGCPSDEFDMESRQISGLINDNYSICEIAEIIAQTFEKYFNNPENPENFFELAKKIKHDLSNK